MRTEDIRVSRPKPMRLCKICSTPSPLYGTVDFNKNCEAIRGLELEDSHILIGYNKCPSCGFLFSSAFDKWRPEQFSEAIYNEDYVLVDPDYRTTRPANNAALLTKAFQTHREQLSVLDYGGGNGLLSQTLAQSGFQHAATYDPFNPEYAKLPHRRFSIVSCFETLEHVPDPRKQIANIAKCADENGIVFFSTLIQPADIDTIGLAWWYAGPRNGHISLFSRQALAEAWRQQGFKLASFNDNLHVAYVKIPEFAQHLIPANSVR